MIEDIGFFLQVVSLVVTIYISYKLIRTAINRKGKSLSRTYYLLALAFILLLSFQVIQLMEILPFFPWKTLGAFAQLVFLLVMIIVLNTINRTVIGYEELLGIKRKERLRDLE